MNFPILAFGNLRRCFRGWPQRSPDRIPILRVNVRNNGLTHGALVSGAATAASSSPRRRVRCRRTRLLPGPWPYPIGEVP